MFDSYFLPYQQILIVVSLLFYFNSVLLFEFNSKRSFSILFLLLGTLIFKIFVISADEFLNLWDEQFHALVAKNMSKEFFSPKLYPDAILPYNYTNWDKNYIWLHKQPLFLMQMALTIKLFGAKVFAMRLPSAICFTFATFCVYKIGENTLTKRIGFIGALFFSLNYFFNEFIVGAQPTDHNDIVFMCYIIASIWAYTEYLKNKATFKWMLLIALFSSFAVLTKWLPGYIVFGIWFVFLIQQKQTFKTYRQNWIDLFKTFCVALILPAVWQLYIFIRFPLEAAQEHSFNVAHINFPLDGHGGDAFFYFESLRSAIGYFAPFFILPGLILLNRYIKDKKIFICFLFAVIVVYAFFTYVATKMPGFTFFIFFIFFLGFGAIGESLYDYFKVGSSKIKQVFFIALIMYFSICLCNMESFQRVHSVWKKDDAYLQYTRKHNINWYKTCNAITKEFKNEKLVVFNCPEFDYIKLMFYTDYIGYSVMPSRFEINLAKIKNYKVAVISNGELPGYILNDTSIHKIKTINGVIRSQDTVVLKTNTNKFISISDDGKLMTHPTEGTKIIITVFEDDVAQLKDLKGKIATAREDLGGIIVFEKDSYNIYEEFIIEKTKSNKYRISTPFRENLVISPNEDFYHTTRHGDKELIVEFVK
ncbi:MAG: glycosyltransferase family 39 protein [Bacteroidetes bacterium]|nr:glycosyltransferase family 39 protein [Bacteroidota bacterium]